MTSDLFHCHRCDGRYIKSQHWKYGYFPEGTETEPIPLRIMGGIPEEHCPICREPPQLVPTRG